MSSSAASGKTSNTNSLLPDRTVIAISGVDAHEFLQGLITNEIGKATENAAVFAALLSPQGKFLFDFFIIKQENKLLLDVEKKTQADLVKRLQMYKLRSQVDIAELLDWKVAAGWGSELQAPIKYQDPRHPELGVRAMGNHITAEPNDEYEKHRLKLSIPDGTKDLTQNRSLPMEWGYDKLHAIDFDKGCYVGQEVTARSKHRATLHKMIHGVEAEGVLPPHGTPIMAAEREVGTMASSVGNIGIALLNIDAVNSSAELRAAETKIRASLPKWLTQA